MTGPSSRRSVSERDAGGDSGLLAKIEREGDSELQGRTRERKENGLWTIAITQLIYLFTLSLFDLSVICGWQRFADPSLYYLYHSRTQEFEDPPLSFKYAVWERFSFSVNYNDDGQTQGECIKPVCRHCTTAIRYVAGVTLNMPTHSNGITRVQCKPSTPWHLSCCLQIIQTVSKQ